MQRPSDCAAPKAKKNRITTRITTKSRISDRSDLHRLVPLVDLNQSFFFTLRVQRTNTGETFSREDSLLNGSAEEFRRMFMRAKLGGSENNYLPEVCIYLSRCKPGWDGNARTRNRPQVTPHAFPHFQEIR
jgi:hypothetical protein